jgi:hypothetical protein
MIKESFQNIFSHYSYLSDQNITSNLLKKIDQKQLNDIKSINDLQNFLYQLNKKIAIEDILNRLFILESNINIIDGYLKDNDEDIQDLRILNTQNTQLLKEIFLMLESKELCYKK